MAQVFKGTKGPWRLAAKDYKTSKYWIHAADHTNSTKRELQVLYIERGDHPVKEHHDRTMYDAHLIAAAPDLLEACIKLKDLIEKTSPEGQYTKELQSARAAISKALNQEV